MQIGFHEAFHGGERVVNFSLGDGSKREHRVKIPPGVKDGGRLRLRGKGHSSPAGGPAGDLFIVFEIGAHPDFSRNGQDVEVRLPLKISEALLGCAKDVPSMAGDKRLKVPAGVKPGTRIRMKGLGFPSPSGGATGDQYAVVEYDIPKDLSTDQKSAIEALAGVDL